MRPSRPASTTRSSGWCPRPRAAADHGHQLGAQRVRRHRGVRAPSCAARATPDRRRQRQHRQHARDPAGACAARGSRSTCAAIRRQCTGRRARSPRSSPRRRTAGTGSSHSTPTSYCCRPMPARSGRRWRRRRLCSRQARCVRLHWTGYVPTAADDASEANPVRRIRHRRAAEARTYPKTLIPAALAAEPGVLLTAGNHQLLRVDGMPFADRTSTALRLGHFPVRSTDQLRAKKSSSICRATAPTRRLARTRGSTGTRSGAVVPRGPTCRPTSWRPSRSPTAATSHRTSCSIRSRSRARSATRHARPPSPRRRIGRHWHPSDAVLARTANFHRRP